MSIEPDVSMTNVTFADGRSIGSSSRVDTPMRTVATVGSSSTRNPPSTVIARSSAVAGASPYVNTLIHSSGRIESGSGR